ncbi:helix-turn-helix transcriptional regulator [Paraburkholderia phytofirmans]|uniref:helix-turn-helix domain-containing protein n=1 Tax=Paraburkholderia phytofirmans TaxID=261302 RepID=UPI0038BD1C2D
MKNATIRNVIASNIERLMLETPDIRTEAELAARARVTKSTVQRILRGFIDANVDVLDAIAKALNVSASVLLAPPAAPSDPISMYRDRIAALPADQQQRIQAFIDSVSAKYEEQAVL